MKYTYKYKNKVNTNANTKLNTDFHLPCDTDVVFPYSECCRGACDRNIQIILMTMTYGEQPTRVNDMWDRKDYERRKWAGSAAKEQGEGDEDGDEDEDEYEFSPSRFRSHGARWRK